MSCCTDSTIRKMRTNFDHAAEKAKIAASNVLDGTLKVAGVALEVLVAVTN